MGGGGVGDDDGGDLGRRRREPEGGQPGGRERDQQGRAERDPPQDPPAWPPLPSSLVPVVPQHRGGDRRLRERCRRLRHRCRRRCRSRGECRDEIEDRGIPILRIRAEGPGERLAHARRHGRAGAGRCRRVHALEGQHSQAVLIGCRPELARVALFGRHVVREPRARCGGGVRGAGFERAGEGKITQQGQPVGRHHDVGGLYVSVRHAAAMRVVQGGCELLDEAQAGVRLQRPAVAQHVVQRSPVDVRHRVPQQLRRTTESADGDDVGVIECRPRSHGGLKPFAGPLLPPGVRQHLQGDHLPRGHVPSEVDAG